MRNILDDFGTEVDNDVFLHSNEAPIAATGINIRKKKKEDSSLEQNDAKFTQFTEFGQGFTISGKTHKRLKSGVYTIEFYEGMPIYVPKNVKSDKWINFRDGIINEILEEIDKFWDKRAEFDKFDILHRRGFLFYGPAGTGKSILCKQIMSRIVDADGIVFYCDHPSSLSRAITYYRQIEPERKITVVFEDIDAIISRYGESDLLAYLDGEDSNNYIFNLATTNYPQKLDRRIVSRPRRFDRIIKIGFPDENMRSFYFKEKLFIENEELTKWVNATENFSFAALTELVISVKCLDMEFDKAVNKIKDLLESTPHSDDFSNKKVGFN